MMIWVGLMNRGLVVVLSEKWQSTSIRLVRNMSAPSLSSKPHPSNMATKQAGLEKVQPMGVVWREMVGVLRDFSLWMKGGQLTCLVLGQ